MEMLMVRIVEKVEYLDWKERGKEDVSIILDYFNCCYMEERLDIFGNYGE